MSDASPHTSSASGAETPSSAADTVNRTAVHVTLKGWRRRAVEGRESAAIVRADKTDSSAVHARVKVLRRSADQAQAKGSVVISRTPQDAGTADRPGPGRAVAGRSGRRWRPGRWADG